MANNPGWENYSKETYNGLEVRKALLLDVILHSILNYTGQTSSELFAGFSSEFKDAVTPEQLQRLYSAVWLFAKHFWDPQVRPAIYDRLLGICKDFAEKDFEFAVQAIEEFDASISEKEK
jgi:hypothetical protein